MRGRIKELKEIKRNSYWKIVFELYEDDGSNKKYYWNTYQKGIQISPFHEELKAIGEKEFDCCIKKRKPSKDDDFLFENDVGLSRKRNQYYDLEINGFSICVTDSICLGIPLSGKSYKPKL